MYNTPYHTVDISQYSFLVTGGAGFIGSNLVEYLLKYGAKKVRVLDNLSNGYYDNIRPYESHPAFEFVEGDICDYLTCVKVLEGIDFVSHQAALGSVPRSIENPIATNDANVTGFLNVLTAVKNNGKVKQMVYAASSSSYGDSKELPKVEGREGRPLSPYAVSKWVNELYADVFSKTYDFHTLGLRYFNVFGPKQNPGNPYAAAIPLFLQAAKENQAPNIFGDGETSRDFTFVENAVQANIRGMLHAENLSQHEVVNIAYGEKTTLNELWRYIQEVTENEIAPIYKPTRAGDIKHSLANIQKAKNLIGYKPLFGIKEGIRITYDQYFSHEV